MFRGLTHDACHKVRRGDLTILIQQLTQSASSVECPFPGVYTSGQGAVFDVTFAGMLVASTPTKGRAAPTKARGQGILAISTASIRMRWAWQVGSDELASEMAEVGVGVLLRDCHSTKSDDQGVQPETAINLATPTVCLPGMPFATSEDKRAEARGVLIASTMLRGSTTVAQTGPSPPRSSC
ncbi:hypothetical protein GCM10011415_01880 [Salipiger pallidus]|uniref:Uncharacterized protein n=1 Tax=Salipiger pallidus TaxID=1775170 RepID=A0A8J2ZGC8_9RHOB|nr:hypothetical protein [Salipiger pallidus]GGG59614.1 hypothetical protein GCM10011415_01880 [Salipiger pallidus]